MTGPDRGWKIENGSTATTIALLGDWIARDGGLARPGAAAQILAAVASNGIAFDTAALGRWDSALLVFLADLRREARSKTIPFDAAGLPPAASRLLALVSAAPQAKVEAAAAPSLTARTGLSVIGRWHELLSILTLVGETVLRAQAAVVGRARMRRQDLLTAIYDGGIAALPIVAVVNILVGGIVAFVGAVQLRKFGAGIFVADLVGITMVREMAPLMTAIVMSGRTGGGYAAQIATMRGNEEVDALQAIGIPVHDYLILPRVLALTLTMPFLYLYGAALGMLGGFAVAVAMLNLPAETFIEQTRLSVGGDQLVFGLVKSIVFGVLIALVGCRSGMKSGRAAADVGLATTSAVVICIVGVIALDAVFAICAHALDF